MSDFLEGACEKALADTRAERGCQVLQEPRIRLRINSARHRHVYDIWQEARRLACFAPFFLVLTAKAARGSRNRLAPPLPRASRSQPHSALCSSLL